MKLGELVKSRREYLKLSQDRLGEMIGKNRQYIRRIECGETKTIKNDVIEKLSKALKCPSAIFFNGFDEEGTIVNPHLGLIEENISPMTNEEIMNEIALNKVMEEKGFVIMSAEDFYNEVIDLMSKTEDLTDEKKQYIKQSLGFACDIKEK